MFAGEVGVIVLGVLLALGAQQAVEDWQMRNDVATFRRSIDTEIAKNLWVYQHRDRQVACVNQRLAEFERWIERAGTGGAVALERVPAGVNFSLYRSAWDARDADVFASLPDRVRAKYAEFYDELSNNQVLADIERRAYTSTTPYFMRGPLDIDDRRNLYAAYVQLLSSNSVIHGTTKASFDIARSVGVTAPIRPDGMDQFLRDTKPCLDPAGKAP